VEVCGQIIAEPATIRRNLLYLVGNWYFEDEFAENRDVPAKIIFKYIAKNVYLVVNTTGEDVRITVLRDGKPLGDAAGVDVVVEDGLTKVHVQEDGLYHLIGDPAGYGEHILEIIIENPGLRAFAFTFG